MSSSTAELIRLSPAISLEKMTVDNYVDMLRNRVNKGYMPSATGERKFNTKPYYESIKAITNLTRGTGYYFRQTDYAEQNDQVEINPNTYYFGFDSSHVANDNTELLSQSGMIKHIMILTDLSRPISHTYVNVMTRTNNSWVGWTPWLGGIAMPIPINPYELKQCLDIYT